MNDSAASADGPPSFPISRPATCPYRPSTRHTRLGESGPMTKVRLYNGRDAWLVTGAAQARAVLSDYRRVSIRPQHGNYPLLNEEFEKVVDSGYADVLFGVDPPEHTRQRQTIMPSFTMRRTAELRDDIQRIVDDSLDDLVRSGKPADLVTRFAQPVPSMVMSLVLGVPYEDHEEFETPAHKLFVPELADEATTELMAYLDRLIARKERDPGAGATGLIDDLIVDQLHPGKMSRDELAHIAMSMLVAGTDTTTNVISLGTLALLDHPEQWQALRDDLDLVPAAVEEILRYVSLVEVFARVAVEDIELDGGVIRAGEGILVSCAGVNFDPRFTDSPDAFDIRRPPRPSFSFSHGIHRCPGDNLARLELEIAFRRLVERFPDLRSAVPTEELPSNNTDGTLQRLYELPVTW
ncbi:cytochrome P450 [Actinoalloteichus sp. AHMU CJ021]|uniref:Cytochrome P450 n=1 Tax=Actinoalloteichus caeruleus DSM 43889 TaxID=1120930 RepID=A0ABT1JGA7_ACTCY|nr:cytochrome P450 [Actinoalloteichus caeruleus]AUS81282.1 cytochrome P450 [Actinoalloteichus sp. AHMU CJ021]MCP2330806.1 Cytochrome P450 [Actinoalloteichus caeruleus DSM 43889]